MRTFYENSVVVDGPDTKRPLADPVFRGTLPREMTLYARQEDLTFGDNIYKYEYYFRPDSFVLVQENMTSMWMTLIPAVDKNKLRSVLAVIDAEQYLVFYAMSMAKAGSFPGLNERIGNSFSARLDAVIKWFSSQADSVFRR
jgi:hypothetical protein